MTHTADHASRAGRPDVVVVGGGIVGSACAWRIAEAGAAVVVVDPAAGEAATLVAAGMLAPGGEARPGEERLLAFGRRAVAAWPEFAAALEQSTGQRVGLVDRGTLVVALDGDDRAEIDQFSARLTALGLPADRLSGQQARRCEPALAPSVRGALFLPEDHAVDPVAALGALRLAAAGRGVRTVTGRVARLLGTAGGRAVRGVELVNGSQLQAGVVVVAAGAWSGQLADPRGRPVAPVRPVRGEVVRLGPSDRAPAPISRVVRGVVKGRQVYLVPRADGRVVIGATSDERGFDRTSTTRGVHDLLRDALLLVPALEEMALLDTVAGLRPGSPDDAPLIGRTEVDGLLLATGHYRNGVLLAPATAEALAAVIAGHPVAAEAAALSPDRFVASTQGVS